MCSLLHVIAKGEHVLALREILRDLELVHDAEEEAPARVRSWLVIVIAESIGVQARDLFGDAGVATRRVELRALGCTAA